MRPPTQQALRDAIDALLYDELGAYRLIATGDYPPYPVLTRALAAVRLTSDERAATEAVVGKVLYRGYWADEAEPEAHPGWQSPHWTLDRERAEWFANRLWGIRESAGKVRMLASFTVRSAADVLYVVDDGEHRGEAEVLLRIDRIERPDQVERIERMA